jgi:hypothetical protein
MMYPYFASGPLQIDDLRLEANFTKPWAQKIVTGCQNIFDIIFEGVKLGGTIQNADFPPFKNKTLLYMLWYLKIVHCHFTLGLIAQAHTKN